MIKKVQTFHSILLKITREFMNFNNRNLFFMNLIFKKINSKPRQIIIFFFVNNSRNIKKI